MTVEQMRELKVGDRVRDRSELLGVVESNDEGKVMIRWAGEYVTYNALTFAPYLTLLSDPQPSPLTAVVAAIIQNDERKILLTKRFATAKSFPNLWQCTGGKVEAGESDVDALRRELAEEIGVTMLRCDARPITESVIRNDVGQDCVIRHYRVEVRGPVRKLEVAEYQWVTVDEALRMELCPSEAHALTAFRPPLTALERELLAALRVAHGSACFWDCGNVSVSDLKSHRSACLSRAALLKPFEHVNLDKEIANGH